MQGGNVPKQYWTYAFNHAVFLHNHFEFKTNGATSWETIRNTTIEVTPLVHLPPFGCRIASYNNQLTQKVSRENYRGICFGYNFTTKIAFALLPNGKIIREFSFQTFDHVYPFKSKVTRRLLGDEFDPMYSLDYETGSSDIAGTSAFGISNGTSGSNITSANSKTKINHDSKTRNTNSSNSKTKKSFAKIISKKNPTIT